MAIKNLKNKRFCYENLKEKMKEKINKKKSFLSAFIEVN